MKKLVSIIMIVALMVSMVTVVKAAPETANIKVSLSKTTAKVGEEVTVTVDWGEVMESADLALGFDKSKVEFVSSSMSEDYIDTNKIKDGVVFVSWFTMNGKGIKNITYTFKVIAGGAAKFTTSEAILADANVESPEKYVYGSATLNPTTTKPTTNTTTNSTTNSTTNTTTKPTTNTTTNTTTKPATNTTTKPAANTTTKPAANTTTKPTTNTTTKPTTIPQAGAEIIDYAIVALGVIVAVTMVAVIVKSKRK